ncbi:MAG: sigma-70 family RNA polymerase sigma factor [Oscillospiraceae bacterium]|nr:sigma-70 family RNA polymerase sigma factor [Oscillospiraceae bacterium]
MLSAFLAMIDSESNKDRFEQLYNKYKDLMFNISYSYLNDYHAANDAVQEAFLRIAKSIQKFEQIDSEEVFGLISVITKFAAIDTYRILKKPKTEPLAANTKLFKSFDSDCSENFILQEIYRLDEKYSSVLYLKCRYGFTLNEVANALNLPVSTVKNRLRKGRQLLAEALEIDI